MLPVLVSKSLHDRWRSLLAWTVGLCAIAAAQLSVYPSVRDSAAGMNQFIDEFPEAFRTIFRIEDYTSGPGFLGTELFSMFVPLIFIGLCAAWCAAATAGEEDAGTADLLLTLPVSRARVVVSKAAALVVALAGVIALFCVVLLLGAQMVDLSVAAGNVVAATLAAALLGLLFGGVALLIGAGLGRRGAALGGAIGLALAAFLLYSLAPLVDWLEPWQKASPFHWALGTDPIRNGLDVGWGGVLVGLSLALVVASALVFDRRDIRSR